MNTTDPTADFDGCNRRCRLKGAHTLVWGDCEHATAPEPTVSLSRVFTDTDGLPAIGFDSYTVPQLGELITAGLRASDLPVNGDDLVDIGIAAAHAIVHRNDEPAASTVLPEPTSRAASEDAVDRLAEWLWDNCAEDERSGLLADDPRRIATVALHWPELRRLAAEAPQPCPTPCDPDCDAACHEVHQPTRKRDHQPDGHGAGAQQQPETEAPTRAVDRLDRIREWVTSDVVTARTGFGDGYREAQRDIRDLLDGRLPAPVEPAAADSEETLPPPEGPEYTPCACDHIEPDHDINGRWCSREGCECALYRPTPPAPLRRSADDCPGFPERCPNLRPVDPNPPVHLGGIRCGCADRPVSPPV